MLQQVSALVSKKQEFNDEVQSIDWIFKLLQEGEISKHLNWRSAFSVDSDGNLAEFFTNLLEQYFVTLKMAALTGLITMSALRSHFRELIKPNLVALMIIAKEQLNVFHLVPSKNATDTHGKKPQNVTLSFIKDNYYRVMLFLRLGSPRIYQNIISAASKLENAKDDLFDRLQNYLNWNFDSPPTLPLNVDFFIFFMTILFINLAVWKVASHYPSLREMLANYLNDAQGLSEEIVNNLLERDIGRDLSPQTKL